MDNIASVTPFYQDWVFWSFAVSFFAIVLSQIPPIYLLLRPRRLDVEVHSRIQLMHRVGNPNIGLVVGISNSGGRTLKVRSMEVSLARENETLRSLSAQAYFETPSSTTSVLLVPFSLNPGESWSHSVSFFNSFDRNTEKSFRSDFSKLKKDLQQKIDSRPPESKQLVEAEADVISPFSKLFERHFIWFPGEYIISLSVKAEPGSASYSKRYRFTLHESDTNELRDQTKKYKYGTFITYDEPEMFLSIPLAEHVE